MTCPRPHRRFGTSWLYYHLAQKSTYDMYDLQLDFIILVAHCLDSKHNGQDMSISKQMNGNNILNVHAFKNVS